MKVGLIGSGFMGRAHAIAYALAARVFELSPGFELEFIADLTPELAERARRALGFRRATGDWRELVADPEVEVVDIAAPNALHKEMALAAIAAGKHVYCEKPLAPRAADALAMTEAAEAAGIKTQVGFNYLTNPLFGLARDMIASGELGEIYGYRGLHAEDFMSDPAAPYGFRHEAEGGGALVDLGSHALATAEFLLGPIAAVAAQSVTLIPERKDAQGRSRKVNVDDVTQALLRFESGLAGSLEANWCATGRNMQHDFEVFGAKGSLRFSSERLSELFYADARLPKGRRGFRRIEAGPEHPPYGRFVVAAGHQIGFNDLKAIEIAGYADALAGRAPEPCNFRAGWRVQCLVEAVQKAAREGGWVETGAGSS